MMSGARRALHPVFGLALLALATIGCFKHTDVDPSKLSCRTDNECPTNWQCLNASQNSAGTCCKNGVCRDGGVDAVAADTLRGSDGGGHDLTLDSGSDVRPYRPDTAKDLAPSADSDTTDTLASPPDAPDLTSPDVPAADGFVPADGFVSALDTNGAHAPDTATHDTLISNVPDVLGPSPDAYASDSMALDVPPAENADAFVPPPDAPVSSDAPLIGAPRISSFTATPAIITKGKISTLQWEFANAVTAVLEPAGLDVMNLNSQAVSPEATTTYTLRVNGTVTKSVTVEVVDPPNIASFGRSDGTDAVAMGTDVPLTFSFSGGTASIDNGIGPVTGTSKNTGPLSKTTTFTLTVTNRAGDSRKSLPLTIVVGIFTATTGSLNMPRYGHLATRLKDGRVLITGGIGSDGHYATGAEIYDPVTKAFTPAGTMKTARDLYQATLLDSGKVLFTGGNGEGNTITAEVFDPNSPAPNQFTVTQGSMLTPRQQHTATLLANGKVLIAGGSTFSIQTCTTVDSAELYDPNSDSFTATDKLSLSRFLHAAVALSDGTVLVLGGAHCIPGSIDPTRTIEAYDPSLGKFTSRADLPRTWVAGIPEAANLLPSNKVLLLGTSPPDFLLFDPVQNSSSSTQNHVAEQTWKPTLTLLPSGLLLKAGGTAGENVSVASAWVYDPVADNYTVTSSLLAGRAEHSATLLKDGSILIAGGNVHSGGMYDQITTLGSAELFR